MDSYTRYEGCINEAVVNLWSFRRKFRSVFTLFSRKGRLFSRYSVLFSRKHTNSHATYFYPHETALLPHADRIDKKSVPELWETLNPLSLLQTAGKLQ